MDRTFRQNGPTFWQMDKPFDKWTNLLTNDSRIFFPVFTCEFFNVKINLDHECLLGVGYFFFFWDHGCLLGVGVFFFPVDRGCLLGVFFFFLRSRMFVRCRVVFEITNVWQVWGIFLRSRMFVRCGFFFFFLRSWMFDRCGVFFFFFFFLRDVAWVVDIREGW